MPSYEVVSIDKIQIDPTIDPRLHERDEGVIATYAECLEDLPPITVDPYYAVLDGIHRLLAHRKAEAKDIKVQVVKDESLVARKIRAVSSNTHHGIRLTTEEVKQAARSLWQHGATELRIAKAVRRSTASVAKYLAEDKAEHVEESRVTAYELHLQGMTQEEIAKKLLKRPNGPNVSQSTVSRYIQFVEDQMKEEEEVEEARIIRLKEDIADKTERNFEQDQAETEGEPTAHTEPVSEPVAAPVSKDPVLESAGTDEEVEDEEVEDEADDDEEVEEDPVDDQPVASTPTTESRTTSTRRTVSKVAPYAPSAHQASVTIDLNVVDDDTYEDAPPIDGPMTAEDASVNDMMIQGLLKETHIISIDEEDAPSELARIFSSVPFTTISAIGMVGNEIWVYAGEEVGVFEQTHEWEHLLRIDG